MTAPKDVHCPTHGRVFIRLLPLSDTLRMWICASDGVGSTICSYIRAEREGDNA